MSSIRSFASSDEGFTISELIVASFLGLLLVALALGSVISSRNVFRQDLARIRVNESLRGALDIVGTDIRLGGESLGSSFPAILLTNGAGPASDTLTIRRAVITEVLPVCTAIANGSSSPVMFAITGTVAGCIYSGQTTNYNAWRTYRLANGGAVDAFIWDRAAQAGEFFRYTGETNTGTTYAIQRAGTWTRNYPTATSAVYMLEEWMIRQTADRLEVVTNQDAANPVTLAFGLQNFQAQIFMLDGSTKTAFTTADPWTNILAVDVTLTATDTVAGGSIMRSVSGRYFPRNVLSN